VPAHDDDSGLDPLMAHSLSRRDLLRHGAMGMGAVAFAAFLAACSNNDNGGGGGGTTGGGGGLTTPPSDGSTVSIDDLAAAAKDEGTINTIALPPDWANYGEIMSTFSSTYGIDVKNASPNGSSSDEITAVKSLAGQDRAPDVLDVSPGFAIQGADEGLFATYKVSTWDTIPDTLKDANGAWVGDYWGAIAFGLNTDVVSAVPATWQDLLNPAYKGKVALNGDPRTSGSAFAGVFAASLANGGSLDDITPGIDFFAKLANSGTLIPVDATPATVESGETPITIDWDYLQVSYGSEFAGKLTWQVAVPTDGTYASNYCQAINKEAPHPFVSRLWQEFLYSDAGQLLWLKGYSHPVRFDDLSARGVIPQDLLDKLPPAEQYANVVFPNADQVAAATQIIADTWAQKVSGV
jgi:putative spermidine/putrescine transport system substrate-binding protein